MAPDPEQTPSDKLTPQDLWNDISLTRSGIDALLKQCQQTGDLQPVHAAIEDLKLKTANYEKLLEEMQAPMKAVLGRNLLGTAEWQQGFGVKVGAPPPIPESVTPELLNSDCPLHPGKLIKDTHILLLIPKTVDGKPYSALKLDELCASRKGSGDTLIYVGLSAWNECDWASLPQVKSEWVLLPKSDPDRNKVPAEKHFREKTIAAQQDVHEDHYVEYREAKALEVMTMAILNELVNGEPRILDGWHYLRCMEPNVSGGRVCVGRFHADGLRVRDEYDDGVNGLIGRALARK